VKVNRYLLRQKRDVIVTSVCVTIALIFGLSASAAVALRPMGGTSMLRQVDNPASRLESLVVEVNGERRRVEPASGFTVVRGDLVTVVEAWLVDKSKQAPIVDIAGFTTRLKRSGQDDRGKVVDTNRDFDPRQSEDGKGDRYAIRVIGSGVLYGETFLTIEEPALISFEVEVNGERRKLTPGDKLALSARDGIRVIDIRTNVRGNENVRHDLAKKRNRDGTVTREIRFTRGEAVFARIPIDWQGS
jgi:hypothetical protein